MLHLIVWNRLIFLISFLISLRLFALFLLLFFPSGLFLFEIFPILSIKLSNHCLIGSILHGCGISTLAIIALCSCSTTFFIVTSLVWSSCVSFEIECTRWRYRCSSICALCTPISAMAMKCAPDFLFETVALR